MKRPNPKCEKIDGTKYLVNCKSGEACVTYKAKHSSKYNPDVLWFSLIFKIFNNYKWIIILLWIIKTGHIIVVYITREFNSPRI